MPHGTLCLQEYRRKSHFIMQLNYFTLAKHFLTEALAVHTELLV